MAWVQPTQREAPLKQQFVVRGTAVKCPLRINVVAQLSDYPKCFVENRNFVVAGPRFLGHTPRGGGGT